MQPNSQQVHEDLATLFSRSLTFNPELRVSAPKEAPRQEPSLSVTSSPQPIVYSISQHYHHSAHVAKSSTHATETPPPQRPSSEPSQGNAFSTETILRHYGIDAAILTPSQLQLFRIADGPQKERLIDLWSIYPPNRGEEIPALAWSSATVEQEEQLARVRYERQQQIQVMSLDGTPVQAADGVWPHSESEPYVVSGYEELMRREDMRREDERNTSGNRCPDMSSHFGASVGGLNYNPATDPVYLGPDAGRQQEQMDMATQYGVFEHLRSVAEAYAMMSCRGMKR